ncbi:MAG TPA: hypothetical protein VK660_06340 [Xanthomonadaceae bacterium]|nr:hypothetical protein [Xanthomonadaceae bacterium]
MSATSLAGDSYVRNHWIQLGPSAILAAGIIGSTLASVLAAKSGCLVLAGTSLLAVSLVGADALHARLTGKRSGPSTAALLLAGAFVLAGAIVGFRDPRAVASLIPFSGSAAWATLFLLRPKSGPSACSGI